MLLGEIPMFCFGILRIFVGKSQKCKNWKIWASLGLLWRSVRNPRRGVDLRQGVGYLAVARPRCQNGTPWVRRGVAKLRRSVEVLRRDVEVLRRSIEVLRHGIATVHSEQILYCYSNPNK